jgi:hypothetical protein
VGQVGESGEYRMGRLRVVYFDIWSFEVGSPCLCRLRTASVGPCCNKHLVVYSRIWDLWGPTNLVDLTVAESDDTPLYFMDDIGSVRVTHGLPILVFAELDDTPLYFKLERLRSTRLIHSHRERWPLVLPSWLTCVVLPG